MGQLTLDAKLSAQLAGVRECMELRDESGRVLGYFSPATNHSLYEGIEIPVSNEELTRREKEGGGYTTEEVLAHLRRLEQS